jgi:isoquinoline 1-oxidoreductase alpha subunit
MAAAALLDAHADPDEAKVDEWMTNICRCGTYARIRKAIRRAAGVRIAPEVPEPAPVIPAPVGTP